MKIISLVAENYKRLSAVEITPDGNMVLLSGRNGQGKSSVLDAIWAALGGATHIHTVPIRQGADTARIRLDLGEMVITRTFKAHPDGATTQIKVENADGFRAAAPQKMLDGLLGALSFDPLAFARMKPREQFDALRRFVPGVDFDAIELANKVDFEKRTEVNRDAKRARAAAEQIVVPSDLPAEMVDEDALTTQLAGAGAHNANIQRLADNRAAAADRVATLRKEAADIRASVADALNGVAASYDKRAAEIAEEIKRLERQLLDARNRLQVNIDDREHAMADKTAEQDRLATETERSAETLQTRLDAAAPLSEPIDTEALTSAMADARRVNDGIRQRNLRDRQIENAEALEASAAALTTAIEARKQTKADAIANAELPVPGLGFGDGAITLNGLPLDQASDAEQLRTSIAIAMSLNPKLRVIRVHDGSLLDDDGLKLLAEMADAADCQVWVEAVRSDGKAGVILEDGAVKRHDLLAAE